MSDRLANSSSSFFDVKTVQDILVYRTSVMLGLSGLGLDNVGLVNITGVRDRQLYRIESWLRHCAAQPVLSRRIAYREREMTMWEGQK